MKERSLVMTQRFRIGLLALVPLACNGVVVGGAPNGDPPPGDRPAPPSDPANPPGGPPSPVGAPPTTGAMAACQGVEAPGPRRLRLLTRSEYASTVADLLGVPRPSVDNLPVESVVDGFDNNAGAAVVTNRHLDEYLATAERIAVAGVPASKGRLAPCAPAAGCDRTFVTAFGQRAFRRPLSNEEITRYLGLFAADVTGGSFDKGMELVIRTMLSSPYFLYRSEMGERAADGTYQLTPYEIATAMSFFLWGTTPDDQLLEAARSGALARPDGFEASARRLIDDRRSRPAVLAFFRQWLGTDGFLFTNKDAAVYPTFDDAVRKAMVEEQDAFVNHAVFEGTGKYEELYNADYVFASLPLARFYGLTGGGATATKIPGRTAPQTGLRGGLLLLGSVLGMHAHPNESSPVRRGVFVRQRLMCQTLPSPPENLNIMPPGLDPTLTTRARFARHSTEELCKGCHKFIDPIGFGFERYDGVAAYRGEEAGVPVDATGQVVGLEDLNADTSTPFDGPAELAALLAGSPNAQACFARQMFRYARGGEDGGRDGCAIRQLQTAFVESGFDIRRLLLEVVRQKSFLTRGGS